MSPSDDDPKLAAEIARLQAARGLQLGAWLRENRTLALVLLGYFAFVAASCVFASARGKDPFLGAVIGVVLGPLFLLRASARLRRL